MKLIIVNGFPKSGKDTFVDLCLGELNNYGRKCSTVDIVKQMARVAGWNGEKTLKDRKFLSDLKDLISEWNDVPFHYVNKQLNEFKSFLRIYDVSDKKAALFVFSREPEEIQRFKDEFNAVTVFVEREECEKNVSNHADRDAKQFVYDFYIDNNGTLNELLKTAKRFLERMELCQE